MDASSLSVAELLAVLVQVQTELARRGIVRTAGSVQGEVGEAIALAVYGGALASTGTEAFDLVDADGRRIQVKTRTLPFGVNPMFQFHSLDFDAAVCIRFDRESLELDWAREYAVEELRSIVTPHKAGPRLPLGRARRHGRDVTELMRTAYADLRESSLLETLDALTVRKESQVIDLPPGPVIAERTEDVLQELRGDR